MRAERWNFLIACANDNVPAEKINFRDEEESNEYDALIKEQDKYEKMTGVRPKFEPVELNLYDR